MLRSLLITASILLYTFNSFGQTGDQLAQRHLVENYPWQVEAAIENEERYKEALLDPENVFKAQHRKTKKNYIVVKVNSNADKNPEYFFVEMKAKKSKRVRSPWGKSSDLPEGIYDISGTHVMSVDRKVKTNVIIRTSGSSIVNRLKSELYSSEKDKIEHLGRLIKQSGLELAEALDHGVLSETDLRTKENVFCAKTPKGSPILVVKSPEYGFIWFSLAPQKTFFFDLWRLSQYERGQWGIGSSFTHDHFQLDDLGELVFVTQRGRTGEIFFSKVDPRLASLTIQHIREDINRQTTDFSKIKSNEGIWTVQSVINTFEEYGIAKVDVLTDGISMVSKEVDSPRIIIERKQEKLHTSIRAISDILTLQDNKTNVDLVAALNPVVDKFFSSADAAVNLNNKDMKKIKDFISSASCERSFFN